MTIAATDADILEIEARHGRANLPPELHADVGRLIRKYLEGRPLTDAVEYMNAVAGVLALRIKQDGERIKGLEAERQWRPIETAPRDGTHILIAFGQDHVSVGSYHRNDDDPHPWKFMDSQGEGLPIFNGARDDIYGPTRWQPLPSAPKDTVNDQS